MSIAVMSSVWKNSTQKANKLLMLLAIADNANDDGWAYPSINTLAQKVRVNRRNAQKIIDSLEADGELQVYNQTKSNNKMLHFSNVYFMPKYGVKDSKAPHELRGSLILRSSVARDTTPDEKVVSPETLGSVARDTTVVSPETPESSYIPSLKEKESAPQIGAEVETQNQHPSVLSCPADMQVTPSESNIDPDEYASAGENPFYPAAAPEPVFTHRQKTDIIQAWWDNLPAKPADVNNPYQRKGFLNHAEKLLKSGVTPEGIKAYVRDQTKMGAFYHDKNLGLHIVVKNAPSWCKAHFKRNENANRVPEPPPIDESKWPRVDDYFPLDENGMWIVTESI